jgi:hypothetical protein
MTNETQSNVIQPTQDRDKFLTNGIDGAIEEAKSKGIDVSRGMSISEIESRLEKFSLDDDKVLYLRKLEDGIEDNRFCPLGGYDTWRLIRKGIVSPVTYKNLQKVLRKYRDRKIAYTSKNRIETIIDSPISQPPQFKPSANHPNIGPDGKTPQDFSEGFRNWIGNIAELMVEARSYSEDLNSTFNRRNSYREAYFKNEEQIELKETLAKFSTFKEDVFSQISRELNQRGFRENNIGEVLERIVNSKRKYAMST